MYQVAAMFWAWDSPVTCAQGWCTSGHVHHCAQELKVTFCFSRAAVNLTWVKGGRRGHPKMCLFVMRITSSCLFLKNNRHQKSWKQSRSCPLWGMEIPVEGLSVGKGAPLQILSMEASICMINLIPVHQAWPEDLPQLVPHSPTSFFCL